jgi:hypothetical protein
VNEVRTPRVPFFVENEKGPEAAPQGLRESAKRSALRALPILQANDERQPGGLDGINAALHLYGFPHSDFVLDSCS